MAQDAGKVRARLLVPAVTTVIIVATLVSLGIWQLHRKDEKRALIAALAARLDAPAAPLPPPSQWRALRPEADEFRRVTLTAIVEESGQAQVYSSGSSLRKDVTGPGVWLFAPARLPDGATVVVNRGFVPDAQGAALRAGPAVPLGMTGYLRFPETPGWLTPPEDRGKRLWFARDTGAMTRALGWGDGGGEVSPFYIDLETPVPASGFPKPGPLVVNFKDDHLQYAITWFLLAAAVSVAFGVWLRGQGSR